MKFLLVYTVTNTSAEATSAAVEKRTLHFGFPKCIIHDRRTAFFNTDFVNWTKEMGINLRPSTAHSPWTNGKVETQNQHIARYWLFSINDSGFNWASFEPKFAFSNITSAIYNTSTTPYEILFRASAQIPMSVTLGFYRNKHDSCCYAFCNKMPPRSQSQKSLKNKLLHLFLRPQLSQTLLG